MEKAVVTATASSSALVVDTQHDDRDIRQPLDFMSGWLNARKRWHMLHSTTRFFSGRCVKMPRSVPTPGVGLGDALRLPAKSYSGAPRVLRVPAKSALRRVCGGSVADYHSHPPRI